MINQNSFEISGHIVDVVKQQIYDGIVRIENGKIAAIEKSDSVEDQYIAPGFIDAHIHIESSMLVPAEFARLAVRHGTIATVSDPHEIANVLGIEGINYMIENGKTVPLKFFFGAPSCVPATTFETSGAILDSNDIRQLMQREDIWFLAEMMNYPGVINKDPEVIAKIEAAHRTNKPVDGHAPALFGESVIKYAGTGISTDHECMTAKEGEEKIKAGMKVIIREGSAAKDFEALVSLIADYPDEIMFCSDDKHPDDLLEGHINEMAKRTIRKGYDPLTVLRICSYNPITHYNIPVGLLQTEDDADFIIVNNLKDLEIKATYIKGEKVAANGKETFTTAESYEKPNNFTAKELSTSQLIVPAKSNRIKIINVEDGQLYTTSSIEEATIKEGNVVADIEKDILKMVVYNRYTEEAIPQFAFIKNFGLKEGAFASTIAHDSHNIVAVGCSDEEIAKAINLLVQEKGGIVACNHHEHYVLPLPVAGLISDKKAEIVAEGYKKANEWVARMGSALNAPYMTLAFMALLVIPELKLSDKGLFDGNKFELTSLFY